VRGLPAEPSKVNRSIRAGNDPATRQAAEEHATRAAWSSVLGTMLAMVAAAVGGYMGSGPTFQLRPVVVGSVPENRRTAPVRS
jgi:hypothetical protein